VTGVAVGSASVAVPPHSVWFRDARLMTGGTTAGSVEVAHNGEPYALVGSQTTISPTSGQSFDTLMTSR
jgi:hypothetical protein